MQDVLFPALQRHFGKATETPGAHDRLLGAELARRGGVRRPDARSARPRARTRPATSARSTRSASSSPTSRSRVQRGYGAGMFSFNAGNGRCPTCGGSGFEHVEMQFLSDVYLRCPDCDGRRFRAEILDVKIDRRLPATRARLSRRRRARAHRRRGGAAVPRRPRGACALLQPIVDVGLEYVKLGQPVPTLSGGEAQRLKLAGFLAEAAQGAPARRASRWRRKRHAVHVRRADHRPALRRHRQADARVPQAARGRATR